MNPFEMIRRAFLTGGSEVAEPIYDPQESEDTAAEKRKVSSLKRKLMGQGLDAEEALSRAIAILKKRGSIRKQYGNDQLSGQLREDLIKQTMEVHNLSREHAIAYLHNLGLDAKKSKKKKKKKRSY
jgi:hypothetical protein